MNLGNSHHQHNIIVFGETLFTEGIAQTLNNQEGFKLVGQSSLVETTLDMIQTEQADLIIVDSTDQNRKICMSNLVFKYPHLHFIFADLTTQSVQLVSSQLIQPQTSSIMTAIQAIQHKSI